MRKNNNYDRSRKEKKFKKTSTRRANCMFHQSVSYGDRKYFKHFNSHDYDED